jgi:hypothetical protein
MKQLPQEEKCGWGKMFWRDEFGPFGHWCVDCGLRFNSFTELYGHKQVWHTPLPKVNTTGVAATGDKER